MDSDRSVEDLGKQAHKILPVATMQGTFVGKSSETAPTSLALPPRQPRTAILSCLASSSLGFRVIGSNARLSLWADATVRDTLTLSHRDPSLR